MHHFVLPSKDAVLQPPLENFQIRQTMCDMLFVRFSTMAMNDQVTVNPPVPVTTLKLRGWVACCLHYSLFYKN